MIQLSDMTATAHALIAGAIAASTPQNPTLGVTLAALSHPILDMIPHWDFGTGWKKKNKVLLFLQAAGDLIFGVAVTFIFFGKAVNPLYLLLAIFISLSWDLLQAPYWLFGWKFPPFSTFYNVSHQINTKAKLPWGILTQAATVTGLVLVLRVIH